MVKFWTSNAYAEHLLRQGFHGDDPVAKFAKKAGHIGQGHESCQTEAARRYLEFLNHQTAVAVAVFTGAHRKATHFAEIFGEHFK